MSSVRRFVSGWLLWDVAARWLQLLIAGLVTAYAAVIVAAAVLTPLRAADLRTFGLLLICTIVSIELTRRSGEPTGLIRDVYAIWDLPVAVLLPPLYIMLVAAIRNVLTQLRVRQGVLYRRAYSASAIGLAYAAASVLFHTAEPVLGDGAGAGMGVRALWWMLLAAGCGILRLAISDSLLVTAIHGVEPATSVRTELIGAEATVGNAAELCLGLLVTFAAAHSIYVVVFAVPLVIWQQRSVRHRQLERAARIDRKTGLINDATWRREAADELIRAVRTRTPVAVGILDVDHFKHVNDTYGHPAGDAVLAAVAATTMGTLRDGDVVGRIGGEEFAFLLPYTHIREAIDVAERLRQVIPQITISGPRPGDPAPASVTVSIGIAAARQVTWSLDDFLIHADRALYAAKGNGRNRVYIISDDAGNPGDPRPSGGNGSQPDPG